MKIGTILLNKDDKYIKGDGNLPHRPKHDKYLLSNLVAKEAIVSDKGYSLLPPTMQKLCIVGDSNLAITIPELNSCDLLIISRSTEVFEGGKPFRLDNFKCLVKDRRLELWISIK